MENYDDKKVYTLEVSIPEMASESFGVIFEGDADVMAAYYLSATLYDNESRLDASQ